MNKEKYEADIRYTRLIEAVKNALDEIYHEKMALSFNFEDSKEKWMNSGIYEGLTWAEEIFEKYLKGVENEQTYND